MNSAKTIPLRVFAASCEEILIEMNRETEAGTVGNVCLAQMTLS